MIFAQMLQELMTERYRRNRAELAAAAHISPSALSQYARGRATPSLDVLVQLAETLDVSIDYLVFGQERTAPSPELGYLTSHLESHMRSMEEQNATLHDLVARIGAQAGAQLAGLVRSTADALLAEAASLGGTLSSPEVARLERCSAATTIFTSDLSKEVVILDRDGDDEAVMPSVFAQVVADNISEGSRYEYIVPRGEKWSVVARLLRQEIIRLSERDTTYVDRHLRVLQVANSCVPGYVVQHLDLERLQRQAADIYERIVRFLHLDPGRDGMGFVAYVEMVNTSSQHFDLIAKESIPRLLEEVRTFQKSATQVALG